jgi:SAM-dependent methyltransferase
VSQAPAAWRRGDYHRFAREQLWEVGPVLVEACGISPGQRVLDVAAGTGNVAIRAAEAGAQVVASDIPPKHFGAGRREAAVRGVQVEWVEADAEALPFADEEFDVVTSSFGAMFAPDHQKVADEVCVTLRMTVAVKRNPRGTSRCKHGTWTFAGSDLKQGATKWRCPTGDCNPKSKWMKADRRHPLIPHGSNRWHTIYWGRSAVEDEFGRLKNEWALTPLRVRGLAKVALHADLTMLARLSLALARARAVPLTA